MHITEIEGWIFHHNGDYSGDVVIVTPEDNAKLSVPFSALRGFMAEYFRERITNALADMSGNELLDRITMSRADTPRQD